MPAITDEQKIAEIESTVARLRDLLADIEYNRARQMALTKLDEAVMWAAKAIKDEP